MQWYKVAMTNDDVVHGRHIELQDSFCRLQMQSGAPKEAAMYEDKTVVDGAILYFSPGAVAIAGAVLKAFGATECSPPDKDVLVPYVTRDA